MRLLLTGSPGIGKTTVIRRILKTIQGVKCAGFYTEEQRIRGQRRGFKICTLDGEEGILASTSPGKGPKIGRYTVHVGDFEELALSRIDMEMTPAELYVIDEIGRMELESKRFRTSIIELLARPSNLLATVAKRGKGFLDQIKVRNDIELIEVTKENRDELPGTIAERIVNLLHSS
jgi:nucleoside-triphosphatase